MLNSDILIVGNVSLASLSLQNTFLVKQWAHYAVVRQANTIYYFVNGVLIKSGQLNPQAITTSTIAINTRYPNDSYYNQGENY